jgi:hypothetical protein
MKFKLLYMCMRTGEPGTGLIDCALQMCEKVGSKLSHPQLSKVATFTLQTLYSRVNVLPPHTLHSRPDISQNLSTSDTGNGSDDHMPCLLQNRKVHDTTEGHIQFSECVLPSAS